MADTIKVNHQMETTMQIAQERITPDMAQEYLKYNTENYRSINKSRVISYANDMKAGKWQLNGEGIKFDSNGRLIDGQHRLQAIVHANVPVDMLVIRNVPTGTNLFDIGSGRSLGQISKAMGISESWHTAVVACANYIVNNGDAHALKGKGTTLDYLQEHIETITKAVRYSTIGASGAICKKTAIIAAVYCLLRTGVSGSDIGDFFRIANTGIPTGHYDASSACIFRNMVQVNNSHSPEEKKLLFSATVSAITDFIEGKTRQNKYKFQMSSWELLHRIRVEDGLTTK